MKRMDAMFNSKCPDGGHCCDQLGQRACVMTMCDAQRARTAPQQPTTQDKKQSVHGHGGGQCSAMQAGAAYAVNAVNQAHPLQSEGWGVASGVCAGDTECNILSACPARLVPVDVLRPFRFIPTRVNPSPFQSSGASRQARKWLTNTAVGGVQRHSHQTQGTGHRTMQSTAGVKRRFLLTPYPPMGSAFQVGCMQARYATHVTIVAQNLASLPGQLGMHCWANSTRRLGCKTMSFCALPPVTVSSHPVRTNPFHSSYFKEMPAGSMPVCICIWLRSTNSTNPCLQ